LEQSINTKLRISYKEIPQFNHKLFLSVTTTDIEYKFESTRHYRDGPIDEY